MSVAKWASQKLKSSKAQLALYRISPNQFCRFVTACCFHLSTTLFRHNVTTRKKDGRPLGKRGHRTGDEGGEEEDGRHRSLIRSSALQRGRSRRRSDGATPLRRAPGRIRYPTEDLNPPPPRLASVRPQTEAGRTDGPAFLPFFAAHSERAFFIPLWGINVLPI